MTQTNDFTEPNIAVIAGLIGDNARAKMLTALMGGRALTATELALEADITAQTASSHLAKLLNGQLIQVRRQGRHKYFQLKSVFVAELLENLLNISNSLTGVRIATGPTEPRLRYARVCYDHLAGELAVSIYDALVEAKYLVDCAEQTHLTSSGYEYFKSLGANCHQGNKSTRPLCKSCLDWSERRNHLAGALGQWMLTDLLDKGWLHREQDSRVVVVSKQGVREISKRYLSARS